MATRPRKPDVFMNMAIELSSLATCSRRKVGCILLDKDWKIVGSGYNGSAAGTQHCIDSPCLGSAHKSGSALDLCEAIHAEQNALMQCADIHAIDSCVVTTFPCAHCIKMLLNTSCKTIYFRQDYAHNSQELWHKSGRWSYIV